MQEPPRRKLAKSSTVSRSLELLCAEKLFSADVVTAAKNGSAAPNIHKPSHLRNVVSCSDIDLCLVKESEDTRESTPLSARPHFSLTKEVVKDLKNRLFRKADSLRYLRDTVAFHSKKLFKQAVTLLDHESSDEDESKDKPSDATADSEIVAKPKRRRRLRRKRKRTLIKEPLAAGACASDIVTNLRDNRNVSWSELPFGEESSANEQIQQEVVVTQPSLESPATEDTLEGLEPVARLKPGPQRLSIFSETALEIWSKPPVDDEAFSLTDVVVESAEDDSNTFVVDPNCPIHSSPARRKLLLQQQLQANQQPVEERTRRKVRYDFDSPLSVRKGNEVPLLKYSDSIEQQLEQKKLSFASLAVSSRTHTDSYTRKLIRMRTKRSMSESESLRNEREKCDILKNLLSISLAFLFLFTGFQGHLNLQVALNGTIGAISLSIVYFGLIVSCLFVPPYLLNRLGCKMTLLLTMGIYALYMLVNFSPKWYSLLPVSILLGTAMAPLWAAKCTYLTEIGVRYAILNVEPADEVVVRFFGIFFMIVHLGHVFGNLISSQILLAASPRRLEYKDDVETSCGHFYVEGSMKSPEANENLTGPGTRAVLSICGVFLTCSVVAAFTILIFLTELPRDCSASKEKPRFKLEIWHQTIKHLKSPKHLLLIPLTIFNGMEQAFIAAEYTKAYVGCCLGLAKIGQVMVCFGVCDALCAFVFGPLIKLFGRMPLFSFAAVVEMLMIFTLLIWPPNPADTAIFYVVAACWGMADGVWNTQINGLWAVLFSQNLEVAFANYRLWESVGFAISFVYTPFTTTETKLYVLLSMLGFGMLGYALIECWDPLMDYLDKVREASFGLYRMSQMKKRSARNKRPANMADIGKQRSYSIACPGEEIHLKYVDDSCGLVPYKQYEDDVSLT